jgi:hypothetical protein
LDGFSDVSYCFNHPDMERVSERQFKAFTEVVKVLPTEMMDVFFSYLKASERQKNKKLKEKYDDEQKRRYDWY